jgi:hypothetical protein
LPWIFTPEADQPVPSTTVFRPKIFIEGVGYGGSEIRSEECAPGPPLPGAPEPPEVSSAADPRAAAFASYLKGLVDIVVTDKNLHSAFLFDRAIDGTDEPRHPGRWPHGYAQFVDRLRPGRNEDFGRSPFFLGSSSDKSVLADTPSKMGAPEVKNNRRHLFLYRGRLAAAFGEISVRTRMRGGKRTGYLGILAAGGEFRR